MVAVGIGRRTGIERVDDETMIPVLIPHIGVMVQLSQEGTA